MKKIFVLFFTIISFTSCNKNDSAPDWTFCDGCPNSEWAGVYEGTGAYYSKFHPDKTENIPVIITITEQQDYRIGIVVKSPNKFYASFNGVKDDTEYYFDMAGTEKSIHLSLYKKENDYKLTGNTKKYVTENDTVKVNQSVSFEILKSR